MTNELEQMRSQIGILKEKLEKQTIINERHIRNSMKSKASYLNRTVGITVFAGIFALVYCTWFFYTQDLSLAFVVSTAVMLTVCVLLTIAQKVAIGRLDFSQGNLVETARTLGKVKKHYSEWHRVAIPMLVIWFGWLMYEIITKMGPGPMTTGFCCGAVTGAVIGGIIGFRINRKVVRHATDILDQIEELKMER